jgi:3-ketosteroid 9alpha-monooxygenase subunit A
MSEQHPATAAMEAAANPAANPAPDARTPPTAAWAMIEKLRGEELKAWRMADVPDRASPDERNLRHDFPFGWFAVAYADELAPGEVKPARYFAQDLAMWRGLDGKARVIDAYCAHYGANMAYGGKVHENTLECPFHAWRYNGQGAVEEIPYSPSIPPQAKRKNCVPAWPVREVNGFILVWYHPERVAPLWEPFVFDEVGRDDYTAFNKHDWLVFSSSQVMADNGVDIAHFKYVHGAVSVPDYEYQYDGIRRVVNAKIKLGTPKGEINGAIDSIGYGPGQGWVKFTGLTDTLLVTGSTPVERDCVHVRFAFTQPKAEAEGPRGGLARALIKDICRQHDQDKVILDRIRRMDPPLVCAGDGPFGRNRAYYSQFYVGNPLEPLAAAAE